MIFTEVHHLQIVLRAVCEAHAKNVKEKVTKWSLKTTEALLDADGQFDIYRATVPPNCFRATCEAYAKKVREKATKCSLKTTEALLDADGHVLT